MAALPEGTPCWADAMFKDLEGAKAFYGDVLGWTFGESSSEYGNYTQAYSGGKAVAAIVPPMPGGEDTPSAWCLYLASADAAATAEKIRAEGGEVLMGPMPVGEFGTMVIAKDPGGVVFGVWQAGTHEGFEKRGEPGAFAWAEVLTREAGHADAFFPAVFPYGVKRLDDEKVDYRLFYIGEEPVLGRMSMGPDELPPEAPSYVSVLFAVRNCDEAVAKSTERGGKLLSGPMDSPYGRFAALADQQGAAFGVIDLGLTAGEVPRTVDVA